MILNVLAGASAPALHRGPMRIRLLASFVLLLSTTGLVRAQDNLVANSDFEAVANGNLPGGGWWLYEGRGQPRVGLDPAQPHGGRSAVRLQASEDVRCALVSAPFAVSPGDELRFEGWVRSDKRAGTGSLGNFGLAFRDSAGRVFDRAYVSTETVGGQWVLLSGKATAPAAAVRAELHLGLNTAPGTLWYDDVRAVITNPISFSLVKGAEPWTGAQEVTMRVFNRQPGAFRGSVRAIVARQTTEVAIVVEPGAEQLVRVPITLPRVGAFDYTVSLLDGGTTVRSVQGKFRTSAPLVLYPASPCYHEAGDGRGATRVDARILVNPANRRGLRLTAVLVDAAGRELETAAADASAGGTVGVVLPVPCREPGAFEVRVRLADGAGRELAQARTDVRVAPRGKARVTLGADGFLRINGRRHFPIGMYSCGRYEEMGRAGFSGTHAYGVVAGEPGESVNPSDGNLKELLDRSWANGMRMMVELPRKAVEKAEWAQIRRRIETFRHHPGLLCWGSEERVARGEAPLANVAALYRLVRELDPDHPLVLGDTRDVIGKLQKDRRNFFPDDCMDVGIWWWYPIPLHAPDANGLDGREPNTGLLQPPTWLTTTLSRKPLWIAIQSYQQPRRDARFPTPAEYRALAYLSVINGVKGLWFYTGSGQRDWQGKPAGLLNKPEEGHWDYVQQLVRELRELEPAITGTPIAGQLSMAPAKAPVEFAVREHGGTHYVFAANKSDRMQSVRFSGTLLAGRKISILFEDLAAAKERDTLPAEFGPFGVHVYKIE